MSGTPQKIINQTDPISIYSKIGLALYAASARVVSIVLPVLASSSSAPSVKVDVKKLQECEEEFDETPREALFAFRSTDLGSWAPSSPFTGGENTNRDPTAIQHWALVVHFPRGNKTYLFEAWKDDQTGLLQAGRAEGAGYQVFLKATYFGTVKTSPNELLTKAKQVSTTKQSPRYRTMHNNCQTWLREFLDLISPELLVELYREIPATETYLSYFSR